MTIALIKIGQRLIKFDDFITAHIIKNESHEETTWMIEVHTTNQKAPLPAFFGTYFECMTILEQTMLIVSDLPVFEPVEEI